MLVNLLVVLVYQVVYGSTIALQSHSSLDLRLAAETPFSCLNHCRSRRLLLLLVLKLLVLKEVALEKAMVQITSSNFPQLVRFTFAILVDYVL